ncbi:hypothetical protein OO013_05020 [Mangrovivirga sp. M17]|uniref:Toxin-antitoxin system YwqK family antitoxin n=1 Tax=Mangrovivirga halotolerans TaxID=2993936 RepID=A0ABT3RPC5_9BACT|nr:hypothetical protein [Mangrovivirga halotolerans]MCX2743214.1 hypothetical protein [Mangrovivirga halotolerans]
MKFYRLFSVKDSVVKVTDYYENGSTQMTGQYKLPENSQSILDFFNSNSDTGMETGEFTWYDKNGIRTSMTCYNPQYYLTKDFFSKYKVDNLPDSLFAKLTFEKIYYKDGSKEFDGFYIDESLKHGIWFEYYANGKYYAINKYKNGLLDGKQKYFYINGIIEETCIYINGKRTGENNQYSNYGKLKKKKIYKNDKVISTEKY